MRRKLSIIGLILLLVLCSVAHAQFTGAYWAPASFKYSWDWRQDDFCPEPSQCLVHKGYNESLNGQPDLYFDTVEASELPRCIDDGQYILDHYCDKGTWSSRTNIIAEALLAYAFSNNIANFELYCDDYESVLNRYDYFTSYGSVLESIGPLQIGVRTNAVAANNFCVLDYGGGVAFGTSSNKEIDNPAHSILLALDKDYDFCDAVSSSTTFESCGDNIWYNSEINAVLYLNASTFPNTAPVRHYFEDTMYPYLKNYTFEYANESEYYFFNYTPAFNNVFFASRGQSSVFSFNQVRVGDLGLSVAGWMFSGLDIPASYCDTNFRRNDASHIYCESQPFANTFFMSGYWSSTPNFASKSIVRDWSKFTGSLRVVP